MDHTYDLIRQAVLGRKQVHALVDGGPRRLCPHVLGTRGGEPRALFFQFAGFSRSGLPPGGDWRCIPLARLGDVVLRDGRWHTRPHTHPQTCIDEVDVAVEPAPPIE